MPNQNHREPSLDLEFALDRQWDAVMSGAAEDPGLAKLDPALVATTRRVHALDAVPSPNPAFTSKLWEDLMQAQTASSSIASGSKSILRSHPLPILEWRTVEARRSLSRLAAAILLIVLLAGAAFAAFSRFSNTAHPCYAIERYAWFHCLRWPARRLRHDKKPRYPPAAALLLCAFI